MAGRGAPARRQSAPSRNALITLDADVARVFGTSEAVNAALRHLIALASIMGVDALKQAALESEQKQEMIDEEPKQALESDSLSEAQEVQTTDDEEEWFDLPIEPEKGE